MKTIQKYMLAAALFFGSLTLSAQTTGQNYVKETTMLDASKSQDITSVQYYDGYSRPVLLAEDGTAGEGKYTFSLTTYDNVGRVSQQWLPAVGTTSSDFLAESEVQSLSSSTYSDNYAYSVNHYDALGRTTSVDGIGSAWRSADKKVTTSYGTNTWDEVRKYKAAAGSGTLSFSDHYSSGTLSVETVTDEDGKTHAVYRDATGKTVLERSAGNHDTYYVYDDMDRLRFVLPPCASDALASTGSWSMDTDDVLRDYAYYYEYDGRGRCTKKKLPGAEHILYEYDSRNRMTFSQDGVQRTSGKWTFYVYDNLNRLVQQGENTSKAVSASGVYLQNYYDNYSFVGTTGFSSTYYPAGDNYGKGNLTGSVITVFGNNIKIHRAYYYDTKGRCVKTVENDLMGGYSTTTHTYSFTDKPLKVAHAVTNGPINLYMTEVYTYTYDSLDRMTRVQHTLDGTTVTLAEYTYDRLGRMAARRMHGNASTQLAYGYNVRGWLESISGSKLEQDLYYTDGNGTPCYNGNISSMTWKAGDEATLRGYRYTYDAMNRLTAGNYGEGSTLSANTGNYTESVGQYDKNGNISAGFVRNGPLSTGSYGAMNALVMTLDGNRLQAVRDVAGATAAQGGFEFVDGVTQTNEYTYDHNGNLTQDLNKGITNISYNVLSLPSVVTYSDGSTVTYCYDAEGRKLKTVYDITGENSLQRVYSNGVIYENNVPKTLMTTEGYIDLTDGNKYYYYLKDHQGNNRVVLSSSGTVMETNHYYPFGGVFSTSSSVQPYKYNGKELDTKNGLNWYDYGARHYDAALGRWHVMDPLAEKMYAWSPYGYCFNNPMKFVDKDGEVPFLSNLIGAVAGATVDYVGQVINNSIRDGFSLSNFTQVDVGDVLISAGEGFITSGTSIIRKGVVKTAMSISAETLRNAIDVTMDSSGNLNASTNSIQETAVNTSLGLIGGELKTEFNVKPLNTRSVHKATEMARETSHNKGESFSALKAKQTQSKTKQYNSTVKEINDVVSSGVNGVMGNIGFNILKIDEEESK